MNRNPARLLTGMACAIASLGAVAGGEPAARPTFEADGTVRVPSY